MIKSIRLVGCQSWEDTTIELLTNKANIIVAPNNVGKSVLFKMLKITANPKIYSAKKRKKLIRWGHPYAMIMYEFTTGAIGAVAVQPTKVLYMFREPGETEFVRSYEPSKSFIQELGIIVNSDGNFIVNIIDTDQSLLLVDSESKSTYEFINMLCNDATIEELKFKIDEEKKAIYFSRNKTESKLQDIESRISQVSFVDTDKLQKELNTDVVAKDFMYECINVETVLDSIKNRIKYVRDYDKLEQLLSSLSAFESIELSACYTPKLDASRLMICTILSKFESILFSKLHVGKEPADIKFLELLELLENVKLEKLLEKPMVCDVRIVDLLELLEDVKQFMSALQIALKRAEHTNENVKVLEKKFKESGSEYECNIYGRVIFDGKECVPYNP